MAAAVTPSTTSAKRCYDFINRQPEFLQPALKAVAEAFALPSSGQRHTANTDEARNAYIKLLEVVTNTDTTVASAEHHQRETNRLERVTTVQLAHEAGPISRNISEKVRRHAGTPARPALSPELLAFLANVFEMRDLPRLDGHHTKLAYDLGRFVAGTLRCRGRTVTTFLRGVRNLERSYAIPVLEAHPAAHLHQFYALLPFAVILAADGQAETARRSGEHLTPEFYAWLMSVGANPDNEAVTMREAPNPVTRRAAVSQQKDVIACGTALVGVLYTPAVEDQNEFAVSLEIRRRNPDGELDAVSGYRSRDPVAERCFNCSKEGHLRKHCPEAKRHKPAPSAGKRKK